MTGYDFGDEETFLGYFAEVHAIWYAEMEEKYDLYESVGRAVGLEMSYLEDYQRSMFCKNYPSRGDVDRRQLIGMLMKDLWEEAVRFAQKSQGTVTGTLSSKGVSWRAYETALGSLGATLFHGGLSFFDYWVNNNPNVAAKALAEARAHGFDRSKSLVTFPSAEEAESSEVDESPEVVESPGIFSGSFNSGSN